jgi:hypothetical protein
MVQVIFNRTYQYLKYLFGSGLLILFTSNIHAQENVWEDLLKQEVEVQNPVYKPVLGIGAGILSYYGHVRNTPGSLLTGNLGTKVSITTFLDNKHYFRTNFYLIVGSLSANQRAVPPNNISFLEQQKFIAKNNNNFQSDLITFGVNLQYSFANILKGDKILRPYIALGIENIQFNPKGDIYDPEGNPYYYWTDGSIRNRDQPDPSAMIVQRSYKYNTDLREFYSNQGNSLNSFAIPVDIGLDFSVTSRLTMRLGTSLHYTFTQQIDGLPGTSNINSIDGLDHGGGKGNDIFAFTYVTFHLDLFSDSKTKLVEKLFADIDNFDYAFYEDEDNDGVFDGWDKCPGTPKGVPVDTVGCPFDDDHDGVPNFRDKQLETPAGAPVDIDGVAITDDQIQAVLKSDAMKRSEVELYMLTNLGFAGKSLGKRGIAAKYKFLDTDKDGYLSFDEVLNAIDSFFDYQSSLTVEDIYELNDFFFSQ